MRSQIYLQSGLPGRKHSKKGNEPNIPVFVPKSRYQKINNYDQFFFYNGAMLTLAYVFQKRQEEIFITFH